VLFVFVAAAAATFSRNDAEYTEENEAVGGPEEVVRVFDAEYRGIQDETQHPQEQQQRPCKPAGITEILNDPGQFHRKMILMKVKYNKNNRKFLEIKFLYFNFRPLYPISQLV
jgi:hypothetical protein